MGDETSTNSTRQQVPQVRRPHAQEGLDEEEPRGEGSSRDHVPSRIKSAIYRENGT